MVIFRYLLKPEHMRRSDRTFDPFVESTVDGIIAGTVQIKVGFNYFLLKPKICFYKWGEFPASNFCSKICDSSKSNWSICSLLTYPVCHKLFGEGEFQHRILNSYWNQYYVLFFFFMVVTPIHRRSFWI